MWQTGTTLALLLVCAVGGGWSVCSGVATCGRCLASTTAGGCVWCAAQDAGRSIGPSCVASAEADTKCLNANLRIDSAEMCCDANSKTCMDCLSTTAGALVFGCCCVCLGCCCVWLLLLCLVFVVEFGFGFGLFLFFCACLRCGFCHTNNLRTTKKKKLFFHFY